MLKPERLLGMVLEKAREHWEVGIRAVQQDVAELREALRASEERHEQHEAALFRQAQVGWTATCGSLLSFVCASLSPCVCLCVHLQDLTNATFAPEVASHDLTGETGDRLARVEITQKELARRITAVRWLSPHVPA